MASYSDTQTLPVPLPSLANRRLTARSLPSLVLPPAATNASSNDNELITPAIAHFPPVCPPAPAPPTVQPDQHHPLPTIILPEDAMKAQPTSSTSRVRINTVYPPNKRAASYTNAAAASSSRQQPSLSPKSMAAASISKRAPLRTGSFGPSRRSTPPPQSRLSLHAHQRALVAQRNAALAQRSATRNSSLSTLDRGIRLLLEEEYREEVKDWMLEKEVSIVFRRLKRVF